MQAKIPVAILGATGSVGQRFIELLHRHPWFQIVALAASKQSAGKPYQSIVNWQMATTLPEHIGSLVLQECLPNLPCKLIFSALDSNVAGEIESNFANLGYYVVSNASAHRMSEDVPLLIPEVNGNHLELLKRQQKKGAIVANPNCSAIGLSLAIHPLHRLFGIEALHVVTLQALSGAGYPGVPSLDIMDNVIPYIQSEEEKLQIEPLKIFGNYFLDQEKIQPAQFAISAQCNRVAVTDGHLACVSIKFKKPALQEEVIAAWRSFSGEPQALQLPMAPTQVIHYFEEMNFPQPKLHRHLDKGMGVSVGRLQKCPVFDYKFTLLSHNTIRGAAGGAILSAELMVKKGFFS